MIDDGGPAFPIFAERDDSDYRLPGMSLRDYFAAAALAGFIHIAKVSDQAGDIVKASYLFADAMLAEREKEEGR